MIFCKAWIDAHCYITVFTPIWRFFFVRSLFELAPDCTLQMSSYTKQISPGIRVGYVVGDTDMIAKIAQVAEDTYITPNLVGQGIVHEFIQRGWLETQLGQLKALYGPRLEAIASALHTYLPDAEWVEPDGGFAG